MSYPQPSPLSIPQQPGYMFTRSPTLLTDSIAVIFKKLPNPIATLLFDRYWKVPFEEVKTYSEAEIAKVNELIRAEGGKLTMKQRNDLNTFVTNIRNYHEQWCKHVNDRNAKEARDTVHHYRKAYAHLNEIRVNSNQAINTNAQQEPVRRFIELHHDKTIALNLPTRPKPPFDPWWQTSAMQRAADWFVKGHLTKRVHWLRGGPGFGKTALLWKITQTCLSSKGSTKAGRPWIANISFDHGFSLERFVNNFIITLLVQFTKTGSAALENSMRNICEHLKLAVRPGAESQAIGEIPIMEQIDTLFLPSIRDALTKGTPPPVVIILDGVDKCDAGASRELWEFIETVTSPSLADLPFYFLLTGSNTKLVGSGLERHPLRDRVDANDIQDYRVPYGQAMEKQCTAELIMALAETLGED